MRLIYSPREATGLSEVVGVILMVAVTVILASVIGTFVLDTAANIERTDGDRSTAPKTAPATASHLASATFEQTEAADGSIHVTATLTDAAADTYEVRLVAESAPDDIERWTDPADDAYYRLSRTVGDDGAASLQPGETVWLIADDGIDTHRVQTYVVE